MGGGMNAAIEKVGPDSRLHPPLLLLLNIPPLLSQRMSLTAGVSCRNLQMAYIRLDSIYRPLVSS